jgi:hypothetical protein
LRGEGRVGGKRSQIKVPESIGAPERLGEAALVPTLSVFSTHSAKMAQSISVEARAARFERLRAIFVPSVQQSFKI